MRVLLILGAGASVDSGLRVFRGAENARYSDDDPEEKLRWSALETYESRQQMLDFIKPLYEEITACKGEFGPTYTALQKYMNGGHVITQNIDGLAGRAFDCDISEVHGNAEHFVCVNCNTKCPPVFDATIECDQCGGVLRPNILLYGETIPSKLQTSFNKFIKCQQPAFVLVVGTSMQFPYLRCVINKAKHYGAKVLHINPDKEYEIGKNELLFSDIDELIATKVLPIKQ